MSGQTIITTKEKLTWITLKFEPPFTQVIDIDRHIARFLFYFMTICMVKLRKFRTFNTIKLVNIRCSVYTRPGDRVGPPSDIFSNQNSRHLLFVERG